MEKDAVSGKQNSFEIVTKHRQNLWTPLKRFSEASKSEFSTKIPQRVKCGETEEIRKLIRIHINVDPEPEL